MDNIYTILAKHLLGESTEAEEELIAQFKRQNLKEYIILSKLWSGKEEIVVTDYDSAIAWEKLKLQKKEQEPATIRLYPIILKWTAVAAIAIFGILTIGHFFSNPTQLDMITQTCDSGDTEQVVLSDSSIIWLNEGASITYPEQFANDERRVTLDGEAYFEVTKNINKPFIVETNHCDIKVLGTTFNVNTNDSLSQVSLSTGKVQVNSKFDNNKLIITPGYTVTTSMDEMTRAQSELNYMAWKTGVFTFDEATLGEVVTDLNKYYDNQIIVKESAAYLKFTAQFENIALDDIIKIISISCKVEIESKNNLIIIK